MSGRGRRGKEAPFTRRPHVYKGNRILVVTEGMKSEPTYLEALRRKLKLHSFQVEVLHPGRTDPLNLVEVAVARVKESRQKKRDLFTTPFDEAWVVFDREAKHSDRQKSMPLALEKAKSNDIRVALSNPCFEFWILLHFTMTTKPFPHCEAVAKELKSYLPKYGKALSEVQSLLPKIPDAVKNADHCRNHQKSVGGEGNPSTSVDELIKSMNEAASITYKYKL